MQFDLSWTASQTLSRRAGRTDSSLVNIVIPETGGKKFGILCVALEDIPQHCVGPVAIYGEVETYVRDTVSVGDALTAVLSQPYVGPGVDAGEKIVAIVTEARTGAGLTKCIFNGSGGHGVYTG